MREILMPHINKQMASFFLTTKCNLRCIYCYNSKERMSYKQQSLPLEIAKAGVDYFFVNNCSRHIRFYGPGEPTQEFELMKSIVDYAYEKAGNTLSTELQTNGCFNNTVRNWILNNINIVWVSFDGEPEVQNANRPCANGKPSSPIIEDNVKWLISHSNGKNIMVGARVTITDLNIERQIPMIEYFKSLGINYIWSDPIFPTVDKVPVCMDVEKIKDYHFDMDKYVDTYIDAYHYAKENDIFYGSFLTCNFDGICSQHCRACTPVPHFTTDGYISACDLVTIGEKAKHMECFVYGKWNSDTKSFDIDNKKIELLQTRSVNNMEHCRKCSVRNHCGGYCLGEVQNETGNLFGQKPNTCRAIKRLAESIGYSDEPYAFMHP